MKYIGNILLKYGDECCVGKEYEIELPDHLYDILLSSDNSVKEAVIRDQIKLENYEFAAILKNSMNENSR